MKCSSVQFALGALLSTTVLAEQPKFLQKKALFDRQIVSNDTTNIQIDGNGNHNDQTNNGNVNNGINSGIQQVNNILGNAIINNFNIGSINYFAGSGNYYYAKLCSTCNIVQVSKGNNTYQDKACPVCPIETFHCPGFTITNTVSHASNGTSGNCIYQPPTCVTCHSAPAPPPPAQTTVVVPCPTCPAKSEVLTCPVSIATSVVSVASSSGPEVAKSILSVANAAPVAPATVTAPASVISPAPTTVVNVPCTTCAVGSKAVVVAQVTPEAATTEAAGSPAAASPGATVATESGKSAPASFTGSGTTIATSALSIVLGLFVSSVVFL